MFTIILILVVVVLCACVFAAMSYAPYCEPKELREANEAERDALSRDASSNYHVCVECRAERDRDECRRCGDMLASKFSRRDAK